MGKRLHKRNSLPEAVQIAKHLILHRIWTYQQYLKFKTKLLGFAKLPNNIAGNRNV
jgi:hypothetical protein